MSDPTSTTQHLYETADEGVRLSFGGDRARALVYYREFVEFVSGVFPAADAPRLLDVGCGSGWSTFALAHEGFDATGIDLNASAFEPPATERLCLRRGSALDI